MDFLHLHTCSVADPQILQGGQATQVWWHTAVCIPCQPQEETGEAGREVLVAAQRPPAYPFLPAR